jgi:Acetyltransferase (isoleucine patch superfamily)
MRHIVIIGNSGAARECFWLFQAMKTQHSDLMFKGFLAFEGYSGELRELAGHDLGSDEAYTPNCDDLFVIGIGDPALRLKAFTKWKARGVSFLTLTHPACTIHPETRMGEANIFACATFISCNTSLGNANYLNGTVTIGHDVQIGNANFFAPFSLILGEVHIGSGNSFGVHSVALARSRIGNHNIIAPGAFIYKGCRDDCVMAGNPAFNIADHADNGETGQRRSDAS